MYKANNSGFRFSDDDLYVGNKGNHRKFRKVSLKNLCLIGNILLKKVMMDMNTVNFFIEILSWIKRKFQ